jgi:HEAT repeat protein
MYIVIILVLIALIVGWWLRSERALSRNERAYLKRRGYDFDEEEETGPPPPSDTRLFNLIESLGDISPYSRQRAAEELARMCKEGRRDPRMLSSLVSTLDDRDASVRSAAASALGYLGDARAIEPIKRRIEQEESIHVRAALQNALEKLRQASLENLAADERG